MVAQDFLPARDVKISVEKEVRRKPSLAELTTIETPGKPMSALDVEANGNRGDINSTKKAKAAKKAKKPRPKKEELLTYEKSDILIITEKPQAAQKIASSLGEERKYTEEGVSYFQVERNGKKILIASAVGHLFNLTQKAGQKGWPVFETEWRPSYEKNNSAFTKRYYN